MKTIEDAVWKIMENPAGVCAKITLDNGIEISIALNQATYGGDSGMFEICVFPKNSWKALEMKCFNGHDVAGWLSFADVNKKIIEIQEELKEE